MLEKHHRGRAQSSRHYAGRTDTSACSTRRRRIRRRASRLLALLKASESLAHFLDNAPGQRRPCVCVLTRHVAFILNKTHGKRAETAKEERRMEATMKVVHAGCPHRRRRPARWRRDVLQEALYHSTPDSPTAARIDRSATTPSSVRKVLRALAFVFFLVTLGLFEGLRRGLRRGLAGTVSMGWLASATKQASRFSISCPSYRCGPQKAKTVACTV